MCGIVFLAGPRAEDRVRGCLARIRHRGPDDQQVWAEGQMALGFVRLAINGAGAAGIQPYHHKGLVGAINGEIYNHRALAGAHGLEPSSCDTHLVLPLLDRLGARVIDDLDGFYAGDARADVSSRSCWQEAAVRGALRERAVHRQRAQGPRRGRVVRAAPAGRLHS